MKIVLIANIPSPYRVTLFNQLNSTLGKDFVVLYCSKIEKNRKWIIPELNHEHVFLKERSLYLLKRVIYYNWDVLAHLRKINPDIIITGGFTPTMLIAILFAMFHSKKHVINTDAWELTERRLSFLHKCIRRIAYLRVYSFLPVSKKGAQNIEKYGIKKDKIFICPYSIEVNHFMNSKSVEKIYDVMFSGQFIDRKMPYFFCDIVIELQKRNKNIKVLLIGDGPLQEAVCEKLKQNKINYFFPGFIQQSELPNLYASAKVLLFPTKEDGWGVVANEACAVGTPVITCNNAGVAGDLIIHGYNGYVLQLEVSLWAEHTINLLTNQKLYENFSHNSLMHILNYTPMIAAERFISALNTDNDYT